MDGINNPETPSHSPSDPPIILANHMDGDPIDSTMFLLPSRLIPIVQTRFKYIFLIYVCTEIPNTYFLRSAFVPQIPCGDSTYADQR